MEQTESRRYESPLGAGRKEYRSWSFGGKTFRRALALSLLWHLFWFFFINIKVSIPVKVRKPRSRVVVLGPVLSESIFRTLAETHPSLPQTFYRGASDFSPPLNLPAKMMERSLPDNVVSAPFGKSFLNSARALTGGAKISPDYAFVPRVGAADFEIPFEWEGSLKGRQVLKRPEMPKRAESGQNTKAPGRLELEVTAEDSGAVRSAEVVVSSGNTETDSQWVNYLKQWEFAPIPAGVSGAAAETAGQKGRIRVYLDFGGE
jgi:TonB family protein